MTWQFVVNPRAGRRGISLDDVQRGAVEHGLDARFHQSTSIDDLRSLVAAAVDDGIDRFVAVGGDGTVHHVVDAALPRIGTDRRLSLAVVPTGSGSDFIRTFGRAADTLDDGLARLVTPDPYPIDIGRIEGGFGVVHFVNAANAGIAGASAATAERLPRIIGPAKYTMGFWLSLPRFRPSAIDVTIGRHRWSGSAINVVVANGQFFGGGLNIAPRASLVDGMFDVQVFSGPRRNAFVIMPRLVFGSHLTHPAVRRYIGGEVALTCPPDWPIEADGEQLGTGPVTISMLRGAVDFVM